MAGEVVVTELIIDASQSTAGSAEYVSAMAKAEAAIEKQTVTMTAGVSRQAQQFTRLAAAADPVIAAQLALEKATRTQTAALAAGQLEQDQVNNTLAIYTQRLEQARAASVAMPAAMAAGVRAAGMQARQLSYQLIDIGQAIPLAFQSPLYFLQNVGFQIAQIGQLYMGQGGFRQAMIDATAQVQRFASVALRSFPLVTVAILAAGAALVGMQHEINQTSSTYVSLGDVALGVFQSISDTISSMLKPAIDAIAPGFATAWDAIVAGVKWVGNLIIGSFVAAIDDIVFAFQALPNLLGAIIIGTANAVTGGVEKMVNGAIGILNGLIDRANGIAGKFGVTIGKIGEVSFGGIDNPYAGKLADQTAQRNATIAKDLNSDYLGAFFGAVSKRAIANANAPDADAIKKAADEQARLQKQYDDSVKSIEKQTADLKIQADTFGMTESAAAAYRLEQQSLNIARENGIELSPKELAYLHSVSAAYGDAALQLEKMKDAREAQTFLARSLFDSVRGANSLADAFSNLAGKIADAALEATLLGTGPLAGLFGAKSSSGGLLGSLFSGLLGGLTGSVLPGGAALGVGGIGHNAAGNDNWRGGPTWVGEQGPEIVNLPRGAQIIPFRQSVAMAGGGQSNVTIPISITAGDQSNAEIAATAARQIEAALDEYDKKRLPFSVKRINKQPRKVG